MEYACGEVGLTFEEFWNMTFAEVEVACKGYETRMSRIKEVPRLIATILMNVNRGKRAAYRLEDIFPLYTDRERKVDLMTKQEYEAAQELFKHAKWQSRN